jgi:nardilysin
MPHDKHRIVSDITLDHVKSFYKTIFEEPLYIQALVQGNMTSLEAQDIFERTAKAFNAKDNCSSNFKIPEVAIAKIPEEGTKVVRLTGFNPKDNNTIISNYYQYGPGTFESALLLNIGCHLMKEPTFDTLRTKEQLGYNVSSGLTITNGIAGISFYVNSQVNY